MTNQNEPMQNMQVHCTKDLSIFKSLHGNRGVNLQHVIRIEGSIKEHGMLLNPIIVNDKYEVIDGQHRLRAAKNTQSLVYYIVANGYSLSHVQTLNGNQKNWTLLDFAFGYAELGNVNYKILIDFKNEYSSFPMSSCILLLANSSGTKISRQVGKTGVHDNKAIFREGTWVVKDAALAKSNAMKISKLSEFCSFYTAYSFVAAILPMINKKEFNFDYFIGKVMNRQTLFVKCGTLDQYRLMIEDIYNYRRKNKVNLRF